MAQLIETDLNEETSKWISGSERERVSVGVLSELWRGSKAGADYTLLGTGLASKNCEFWPENLGIDGFQGSK